MKCKFISKVLVGSIIVTTFSTLVPVVVLADWEKDYQGNFYYTKNGEKLTGWKKIDGQSYYFDDNGIMQTGWIQSGSTWYFLQNNGAMKIGWVEYNGNMYYTDSSGVMQIGTIEIAGKIYIFNNNGAMRTQNTIINGQFYTIGLNGEVAGEILPTPDKKFDAYGKCIDTINNIDSNTTSSPTSSPTSSNLEDEIEDESDSDGVDSSIKYTVEYIDSDGTVLKTKNVKVNKHIDLYEPTKDGYKFEEWNARMDGSGKSYDEGDSVKITKDLTLYAQWSLYVNSISINGSSSVAVNSTTKMTVTVSPSNAGDTSVTWSVTAGTGSATIDSSGTLTGVSSGTVTVTATANDGSGVSESKQVTIQ